MESAVLSMGLYVTFLCKTSCFTFIVPYYALIGRPIARLMVGVIFLDEEFFVFL